MLSFGWITTFSCGRRRFWLYHMTRVSLTTFVLILFIWINRSCSTIGGTTETKAKEALTRKQQKNRSKQEMFAEEEKKTELLQRPKEYMVKFRFPNPAPLNPPILGISNCVFGYGKAPPLFKDLDFDCVQTYLTLRTVAIVGPNGVGKSTFLKLLVGDLEPQQGELQKNHRLAGKLEFGCKVKVRLETNSLYGKQ
ncbi:ABCF1-like protein [Mya arenaria]|uniref:ABCF1-like protein n=1 Tax=Mya arenaria TaxID=6604 RepID=A0ABY7GBD9_MYAAR|nr:ABCF1-like protein [Mya arenaria]